MNYFGPLINPIIEKSAQFYGYKTYHLVRIIFARLPSGGEIQKHVDTEKLFGSHHRVHVPVVTSNNNIFEVMDKRIEMNEGSVIEINNCREHYCINKDKNDRIHLIFDMGKGHRKKLNRTRLMLGRIKRKLKL